MLDLCLLGCGGGMPMPNRFLSATLLSYKGRKILIDCGEGTQVSMRMISWGFKTLDIICITHVHGDHIVGLPGLLGTMGNSGREEPVTIIGPKGIKHIVESLLVIAKYLPYEINIIENEKEINFEYNKDKGLVYSEEEREIKINTMECDHSAECIGYSFYIKRERMFNVLKAAENNVPKILWNRLQKNENVEYEGKVYESSMVLGDNRKGIKLSLITDTRPLPSMIDFIKESDLFICEGTYGDDEDIEKAIKNKHMTFREAGLLAKEGKVHELLLTHFSPSMREPSLYKENTEFENTIIGEDRLVKSIKFEDKDYKETKK
ncbi:MAG: ribonuclease Z [Clostridium sp.]|uniref:ribonuclease Z n=1 Tax=Clostridium sp. TaxID=1506 RepID=UPI003EE54B70